MPKNLAYIRVSTDRQDVGNQRLEILEYARRHDLRIEDFIEVEISSRKSLKERRIIETLERLSAGDTLIVSELSRLGRSTSEVIELVNQLAQHHIGLMAIKQGLKIPANGERLDMQAKMVVTMFSLFAELERDIISERTRQALAAKKAQGRQLGKPRGTIQHSKLDGHIDEIRRLLAHRVPMTAIARLLSTSRTNLAAYIRTRNLAKEI